MMSTTPDLTEATRAILADAKLRKRLRYTHALQKVGKAPTEGQLEMLVRVVLAHLEAHYISLPEAEFVPYVQRLTAEAWGMGDLMSNFALLKQARK